ncbi:MAG: VTT domain-containing protein [Candidatus Microgenomates bacterium]|jgi:uncharacterized membrane protein YdjX (TVP38/TMEM64 family)
MAKTKKPNYRKILLIAGGIILAIVVVIIILNGRHYFSRRSIRQIRQFVSSYGTWSPLAVFFLILISTVIPPLPLPVPLVEIASGVLFGFWWGFIVTWVSQIGSSLVAFAISRLFRKSFLGKFLNIKILSAYKNFLEKKGATAVFITRVTMAAPFNVTSYLAGFTHMKLWKFLLATVFGTITETALYAFVGSKLRGSHFNLWYLFIIVVATSVIGYILTYLVVHFSQPKNSKPLP